MDMTALLGIAVGLSMDAFAASVSLGARHKKKPFFLAVRVALCFGIFQGLMPLIGWIIGIAGARIIVYVDHWIALILLSYIGVSIIRNGRKSNKEKRDPEGLDVQEGELKFSRLIILAVATSIDALATGVILPGMIGVSALPALLIALTIIGGITFCFCFCGVYVGKAFGSLCSKYADYIGGTILIIIGVKLFCDHMFFQ